MSLIKSGELSAVDLLRSPQFFRKFLSTVRRLGLVGEERNASALYVVAVSALLNRPLNAIVKGSSSAGKNLLVSRVLKLIPLSGIVEITSSSATAWNYSADSFSHKVVYLQERNDASGAVHPVRLLISEGRLVRIVTEFENGIRVPKTFIAEGPICSISTTTRNRIEVDDETRHLSLWVNETAAQTRKINAGYVKQIETPDDAEISRWHEVHGLIEAQSKLMVTLPDWFTLVADRVYSDDVTARRYWPAFVEACKTVSLIRSFQRGKPAKSGAILVTYADYAITTTLFERIFVESLHRKADKSLDIREAVRNVSAALGDKPIDATSLANFLGVSVDTAYKNLRNAADAGLVRRTNSSAQGNIKLFLAAEPPRFLPDPKQLLAECPQIPEPGEYIHPFTGEVVAMRRPKTKAAG
jgi:hypothetical protein